MSVHPISDLDARSEALVRLLRTVLDEAHQLLGEAPLGEETAALSETIETAVSGSVPSENSSAFVKACRCRGTRVNKR